MTQTLRGIDGDGSKLAASISLAKLMDLLYCRTYNCPRMGTLSLGTRGRISRNKERLPKFLSRQRPHNRSREMWEASKRYIRGQENKEELQAQ